MSDIPQVKEVPLVPVEAIVFVVAAALSGLIFKVFTKIMKDPDSTVAQVALTILFALTSQGAVAVIPTLGNEWLALGKLIASFIMAAIAIIMLGISGGLLFSLIGVALFVLMAVLFYQSLPSEAQAVLARIFDLGSAQWKKFGENQPLGR